MLLRGIDVRALHQIYDYYEGEEGVKELGSPRRKQFVGMTIESRVGFSTILGFPHQDRHLTLPKKTSRFQKIMAYVLLKLHIVGSARKESSSLTDSAFDWNAGEIFSAKR